ncbi:CARDB domain-containing protein [Pseudomonadota bacterium]
MSTRIKYLIGVIIIGGHITATVNAAERESIRNNYPKTSHVSKNASQIAKERVAQNLGLSNKGTLKVRRTYVAANGDVTTRYRQMYRGIPVIGDDIIISRRSDKTFKRAHGFVVRRIADDVADITPAISKETAVQMTKRLSAADKVVAYENEKSQLAIWQNKDGIAKLVYEISFMQYGEAPSRPYYIIDAKTGEVLKYFDNLQSANETGPGGNEKTGQYYYGTDFGYLNVTQSGNDCFMNNADVKTVDLEHSSSTIKSTAFSFTCPENTYKFINGAYSPINDAHYFGGVVFNMYQELINTAPLTFQLVMKVHYKQSYENAHWTGTSMLFGDGKNKYYPLVSLDLSAHEISHGFTEQNSNLAYAYKPGGLNEAFSDMSGEAAEYYFSGTNDWMVAAQVFKASGALRYMNHPPQDGKSIDHQSNYVHGLDVHYSSGVYNKAFYNLATTPGWDTLKAFEVYATANMLYWTRYMNWDEAGNGVMDAACDLGYDTDAVKASLAAVGITSDISDDSICRPYLFSVTPEWQGVLHGGYTSYDVTITSQGGFSEPITLEVETPHPGITATLADSILTPSANGQVSTTITVATAEDLPGASYPITVNAIDEEGAIFNVEVTLKALYPDFDIALSPAQQIKELGTSAVFDIVLTSIDGFSSTFSLGAQASDPSLAVSVVPGNVTVPADGSVNAILTVDTSPSTPKEQQHTIMLTATDGEHTKSIYGQLQIMDIDLVPTTLSTVNASGYAGENIGEVEFSIVNQGSSSTVGNSFGVGLYLSTDATITTADRLLYANNQSSPLGGGAIRIYHNRYGQFTVRIPSDIEPGSYYLGVIADHLDTEPEIDESNNTRAIPFQVLPAIDLTMTALSTPSSTVSPGEAISVSYSIANQGNAPTTWYPNVGFYLSTDATITTADTYVTYDYAQMDYLAGGSTVNGVKTVTIPAGLAAGTYYLGAITDYNNNEPEADEGNNALALATPLQVASVVDLTMTTLSAPSSVGKGDVITISYSISNQGNTATTTNSNVGIYLSTDSVVNTQDTLLGEATVPTLAAGGILDHAPSVTIPANLDPGTYYLGVIADHTNQEPEVDEGNNTRTAQIQVQSTVDLVMTAVSTPDTNVSAGESITANFSITNEGTSATTTSSYVGIYLSTDTTITSADRFLTNQPVSGLAADETLDFVKSATIPVDLATGTYYLGVIADFTNSELDADEGNNSLAATTALQVVHIVQEIDLTVSALSTPSSIVGAGEVISVSYSITNQGNAPTTWYPYVGFYLSTDATITTADTYVTMDYAQMGYLAGGATVNGVASITIPAGLGSGTYYLGAITDYNHNEPDVDESNNALAMATPLQVGQVVDLTVSALSTPSSNVSPGEAISVNYSITNLGNASTVWYPYAGFYLSTDATITTADIYVAMDYAQMAYLAGGATVNGVKTVTIPAGLVAGTYYLGAITDYNHYEPDVDESNNALAVATPLQLTP